MKTVTDFDRAVLDIAVERRNQDEEWGGPHHDDTHDLRDWCGFIDRQNRLANRYANESPENHLAFESRMVKVAALAVAAIESSRRQREAAGTSPQPAPCPKCGGSGQNTKRDTMDHLSNEPCPTCKGTGQTDI